VPSNAASSPDGVALTGTGTVTGPPSADVQVTMTGPTSAAKGAQVTYQITVVNIGPDTAHNVVLTIPAASGATQLAITASQGSCAKPTKRTISCSLGDLAMNGTAGAAVRIKVTAKIGATVTNTASAVSTVDTAGPATADPDVSNNSAVTTTLVTR
jgi:uncharacterized repeat protein (TIGR01451 family)